MEDTSVCDLFGAVESEPAPRTVEYYEAVFDIEDGQLKDTCISLRMVKSHVLWANYLWNGGRWLANHLSTNVGLCRGRSVVELGAGSGLPSIVAGKLGAERVCCTDYPDQELVDNLRHNFARNELADSTKFDCRGFLWGDKVEDLLAFNENRGYDLVFLCDLVFNHSEHQKLIKSTLELLDPEHGTAFCVFTHYRPHFADRDLAFLQFPEWKDAGWQWEKIAEERGVLLFEHDRGDPEVRRTIHAYRLVRVPATV